MRRAFLLSLLLAAAGLLAGCCAARGATVVAASPATAALPASSSSVVVAPDSIRVILLGSGVGPPVNLRQFGPSTLIEAGGQRLLFDCGRGATLRLVQAGIPLSTVTRVFLTHLHSDHIVQLPDLFLTGWPGMPGRKVALEVWGPAGTEEMMKGLEQAFAFDIHMRRDVDEKLAPGGIVVQSHDVAEGVVFSEGGVTVTSFFVDHGPVSPALGYRIDFAGRSVVLSGDTRPSDNLVRAAQGADVLIHEAVDPDAMRAATHNPTLTEQIIAHHTTAAQAGEIFSRVRPRLAVFSHAPGTPALLEQTHATYAGPLEGAEDLLTIDVGEQITVHHFGRP